MNLPALLALLFTTIIWGVGPVFLRTLSVDLGAGNHLVIRYTIVSFIYLAGLFFFGGFRIDRKDWPRLLLISWAGMLGYNLGAAFGFQHVSAGLGSLIMGTQPLLIAGLAALVAREKLTTAIIIGLVIAFIGTGLLVTNDLSLAGDPSSLLLGAAQIFVSGIAWSIYVVMSKPLILKYGSYKITALSISLAALAMILLFARASTFETLAGMSQRNWLEMAYLGLISTFLATITWNFGAARTTAATCGSFLYFIPIIGVIAGAIVLGEHTTPGMLIGGALIIFGVLLSQSGGKFRMDRSTAGLLAILFAVTMWGLIPVAMRFLITTLSPEAAMVLRLYPAGLIAIVVLVFVGMRRMTLNDWLRVAAASLAGNFGYQVLAAYGMQGVPASWTGLIFGLEPVFIALLAALFAGDKLTSWLIGGIAIALAGTAMLVIGSSYLPTGEVSTWGLLLVTASTLGWGIYTVLIRPVANKYGAFETACLSLGISALPVMFFVRPEFPEIVQSMSALQWSAVAFVVIFATFLATTAWNFALGSMESSLAGMFLYVQPLVAALGGIFILGESLTWPLIAGGALIIAGVALSQFGPRMQRMHFGTGAPAPIQER